MREKVLVLVDDDSAAARHAAEEDVFTREELWKRATILIVSHLIGASEAAGDAETKLFLDWFFGPEPCARCGGTGLTPEAETLRPDEDWALKHFRCPVCDGHPDYGSASG